MLLEEIDTMVALKFLGKDKPKIKTDYSSKSVVKKYYQGMKQRVKSGKSYRKKGIRLEITYEQFEKFWFENMQKIQRIQDAGFVVSIDRTNSNLNYSLENIRVLPLHLNRALGKLELCQEEMKRIFKTLSCLNDWV